MKVLVNKYKKNENVDAKNIYPKKIVCDCCESELEYDESDIYIGAFGCPHVDCPLCGSDNPIYDEGKELTLTKYNIEFPAHFWHTSVDNGAKDCCNNEEVRSCINRGINYFRENKSEDEYYWFTEYGNLHVSVRKLSGDESYEVIVTKDYYETSIPFEAADY